MSTLLIFRYEYIRLASAQTHEQFVGIENSMSKYASFVTPAFMISPYAERQGSLARTRCRSAGARCMAR
jgi:hypothetical protein